VSALQLFNSRSRSKQRFAPLEPGHARVYSCGPTVYSPQHIGNLRSCVFADLLKRALLAEGLRVTHVINITDVGHLSDDADAGDDKMERAARESGRRASEIAAEFSAQWNRDRRALNCLEPEVLCRATEHIPEQIEMIRRIEAQGACYRIADGIYFDIASFPRYAELARLPLEAQRGSARMQEAVPGKRHPADFALWKFAQPGVQRQQEWDSDWGRGFPGWHIECSAMSTRYLGEQFDIHTGGVEHLPVHHSNELAQSETALGVHPWVQFWMHHDWIVFGGEKLSKSRGGAPLLQDLQRAGVPPLAYRYFLLQAHYRKQQHWGPEAIEAAARGYRRLLAQSQPLRAARGDAAAAAEARLAPWREDFRAAVRDDLNAPRALALAARAAREESLSAAERCALLEEFDRWLGLDLLAAPAAPTGPAALDAGAAAEAAQIEARLAEREAARKRRDFAAADRIRDELAAGGIVIEDTPAGPVWRRR